MGIVRAFAFLPDNFLLGANVQNKAHKGQLAVAEVVVMMAEAAAGQAHRNVRKTALVCLTVCAIVTKDML